MKKENDRFCALFEESKDNAYISHRHDVRRHCCFQVPLLGPLSPAVFLMALLPSAEGKSHAPGPLQHLTEPGSPIADVYQSCPQCMALLAVEKQAIAEYLQVCTFSLVHQLSSLCVLGRYI